MHIGGSRILLLVVLVVRIPPISMASPQADVQALAGISATEKGVHTSDSRGLDASSRPRARAKSKSH